MNGFVLIKIAKNIGLLLSGIAFVFIVFVLIAILFRIISKTIIKTFYEEKNHYERQKSASRKIEE